MEEYKSQVRNTITDAMRSKGHTLASVARELGINYNTMLARHHQVSYRLNHLRDMGVILGINLIQKISKIP